MCVFVWKTDLPVLLVGSSNFLGPQRRRGVVAAQSVTWSYGSVPEFADTGSGCRGRIATGFMSRHDRAAMCDVCAWFRKRTYQCCWWDQAASWGHRGGAESLPHSLHGLMAASHGQMTALAPGAFVTRGHCLMSSHQRCDVCVCPETDLPVLW